jgi:hypothetical protein
VSKIARPLEYGKQVTLQPLEELAAGTRNFYLTLDSSAVIISLYVPTLSGNVDCRVYTRTDENHEILLKQFTQVTSAMSELTLLRVDDTMGEVRVELISTGTSEIEVKARAAHSVSTTGTVTLTESLKTQILNATDLDVTINYLDAGTCDERITSIEYDAPSVTSSTLLKSFNYTLVGSSYVLSGYTYTLS